MNQHISGARATYSPPQREPHGPVSIIVTGVSAAGKSTQAAALASSLGRTKRPLPPGAGRVDPGSGGDAAAASGHAAWGRRAHRGSAVSDPFGDGDRTVHHPSDREGPARQLMLFPESGALDQPMRAFADVLIDTYTFPATIFIQSLTNITFPI